MQKHIVRNSSRVPHENYCLTAGLRLFKTSLSHTISNGYQYGVQMTKYKIILNNRTHISDSMQMYQRDRQHVKHIYFVILEANVKNHLHLHNLLNTVQYCTSKYLQNNKWSQSGSQRTILRRNPQSNTYKMSLHKQDSKTLAVLGNYIYQLQCHKNIMLGPELCSWLHY